MTSCSSQSGATATDSALLSQDEARGRHAGTGGDEHVLDVGHLVHRRAAQLAHALGDAVHAVDVGLAELAAVGVDRQPAADLDRAVGDEVLGLAPAAEPQLLQLNQRERREVVVEDRGLDVGRLQPGLLPQLPADQTHLGQTQLGPVVADHRVLVRAGPLRRRLDDRRAGA